MGAACGIASRDSFSRAPSATLSQQPGAPLGQPVQVGIHADTPDSNASQERKILAAKFLLPSPSPQRRHESKPLSVNTSLANVPISLETSPSEQELINARKRKILLRDAESLRMSCQEGNAIETRRILKKYESESAEKVAATALLAASSKQKTDSAAGDTESPSALSPVDLTRSDSHISNKSLPLDVIIVNICDPAGNTSLANASIYGNAECVELLLSFPGTDVNTCSRDGRTALHCAAYNGHHHLLTLLATHGCRLNAKDRKGNTPLHYALANQFEDCAKILLEMGASSNLENCNGQSPLSLARRRGSSKSIIDTIRAQSIKQRSHSTSNSTSRCPVSEFAELLCGSDPEAAFTPYLDDRETECSNVRKLSHSRILRLQEEAASDLSFNRPADGSTGAGSGSGTSSGGDGSSGNGLNELDIVPPAPAITAMTFPPPSPSRDGQSCDALSGL